MFLLPVLSCTNTVLPGSKTPPQIVLDQSWLILRCFLQLMRINLCFTLKWGSSSPHHVYDFWFTGFLCQAAKRPSIAHQWASDLYTHQVCLRHHAVWLHCMMVCKVAVHRLWATQVYLSLMSESPLLGNICVYTLYNCTGVTHTWGDVSSGDTCTSTGSLC